jgi:hypothetical protein
MKKLTTLPLVLLLLVGCATPTPQENIKYYSEVYHYSELCSLAGFMDSGTAGKGMAYASRSLLSADKERGNAVIRGLVAGGAKADKKTCDVLVLRIKEAEASSSYASQAPVQNSFRTTNCSTYFGQTRCTSY